MRADTPRIRLQSFWAAHLAFFSFCLSTCFAGDGVDYATQIKPILSLKCFACHGRLKQEAGLRLDASSLIQKGSESGPVIRPGKANSSELYDRVASADAEHRMPPEGEGEPLTKQQLALVRQWIAEGAKAPDEPIPADPKEHWAYQVPRRPIIALKPSGADVSTIDVLLSEVLARKRLETAPPAAPHIVLRRLYLDLTGLPPSRESLHRFLKDPSLAAYETVVDQLLNSPQYGERWGRHWMDIWRYSDWAGFGNEIRYSQRHIWRWRDWIIESLNSDKGYDEMIRDMLAADELKPSDTNAIRATGFLARNWYKFDRNVWLDDVVEHTGRAFLGATFKCARCHDHKYDPLRQVEYYQLRSVFEPYEVRTDPISSQLDPMKDGLARVYDAKPAAKTYLFTRGDPRQPDKEQLMTPGVPQVMGGKFAVAAMKLPAHSYYPSLRPYVRNALVAEARSKVKTAQSALAKAEAKLIELRKFPKRQKAQKSLEKRNAKSEIFVSDHFAKSNSETWHAVGGEWKVENGRLLQSRIENRFVFYVTKSDHPRDFAAKLDFTPTGGTTYRSVGFAFDWTEPRFQGAYMSAKGTDSTASVFSRVAGKELYPADGIVKFPFKVGQRTTLEIWVRDRLLNLRINGKHILAYPLPAERHNGKFAIFTYDSSAQFHNLLVQTLTDQVLTQADSNGENAKELLRFGLEDVENAKQRLAAAQSAVDSLKARIAAEEVKHNNPGDKESLAKLALLAAENERKHKLLDARAKYHMSKTELARATAKDKGASSAKAKAALAAAKKKEIAAKAEMEKAVKAASERKDSTYTSVGTAYPTTSTGRRSALAHWITSDRNPLTARVAVNHIWLRHFGSPLVENVDDFGLRSERPELIRLLDFLAVELMENDWSMKHVHRLIVLSKAYRMASVIPNRSKLEGNRAVDPDNRLFWRANTKRMEAELVRDSMLMLGGSLDSKIGGPDIDFNQGQKVPRRSLYFKHARERQMQFLTMFDPANPRECYRRRESIRPQQAFAMVNSTLALTQSRQLAKKLTRETKGNELAYIKAAFETVLSRKPIASEVRACQVYLAKLTKQLSEPSKLELLNTAVNQTQPSSDPQQRARENLVLVLFNHNDFVTIR